MIGTEDNEGMLLGVYLEGLEWTLIKNKVCWNLIGCLPDVVMEGLEVGSGWPLSLDPTRKKDLTSFHLPMEFLS